MTEQVETTTERRTDQINLSDVAAGKVKSLLEQEGRDDLALRITGYQAVGRDLTVYYKVSPRSDCSTAVVPPAVRETGRTVAVRLVRAPMSRPDGGCAGRRRLNSSVEIRLDRPMNGRLLADLTHHGELVTPAHAAP